MEIYLIRHTTPQIEKNVCYGQSDISLAATLEREWQLIKPKLPSKIDKLFTSPLSRCTILSNRISEYFQIPAEKDDRLLEMNFGDWEMKKWDDINPRDLTVWMNDYLLTTCPGGESYRDVQSRLKTFISENLQNEGIYIMVTHGGIIKCFHGIVNNTDGMDLTIGYGQVYHFGGRLSI